MEATSTQAFILRQVHQDKSTKLSQNPTQNLSLNMFTKKKNIETYLYGKEMRHGPKAVVTLDSMNSRTSLDSSSAHMSQMRLTNHEREAKPEMNNNNNLQLHETMVQDRGEP